MVDMKCDGCVKSVRTKLEPLAGKMHGFAPFGMGLLLNQVFEAFHSFRAHLREVTLYIRFLCQPVIGDFVVRRT